MANANPTMPESFSPSPAKTAQAILARSTLDMRRHTFLAQAKKRHGESYDYSEFIYVNVYTKGKILCPVHGAFCQTPRNHLQGTKGLACRECKWGDSFKRKCKALGIDYSRAYSRRKAGMPEEKIFANGYLRGTREVNPIAVWGITYPNLAEAIRALQPPATAHTIACWIANGLSPEQAFQNVPNPGYTQGIVYLVTHRESGKRYVGLTIQLLARRWKKHLEDAWRGQIKMADSLHAAIRAHGPDAFDIKQIDEGTTKKDLEQKEQQWIKTYGTLIPNGYNISSGGVSGGWRKPTIIDGLRFGSVKEAVAYVAKTRQINPGAAARRIRQGRIDVKTPAKPGESLLKTKIYRKWSAIIYIATNPKSKGYVPGISLYPPWRDFTTFYQDVGEPPRADMALLRLNKAKGFSPDNCAWVNKVEAFRINAAYMKTQGTLVGNRTTHRLKTTADVSQLSLWEN